MKGLLPFKFLLVILISACSTESPLPEVRRLPTAVILPTATPIPMSAAATETLAPTLSPTFTETHIPSTTPTDPETPTPTATEVRFMYIAIAVKSIPAGYAIPPEAVILYPWPEESVPFNGVLDVEEVVNKVALVDIHCFEPFLTRTLALREVGTGFETLEGCPTLPPQTGAVALADVVVATQYVEAGEMIRPAMVAMRQWPAVLRPHGTISRFADVIGKETQEALIPEQPIYYEMLTGS